MKKCHKCGTEKSEVEFYLRKDSGERRNDCKKCCISRRKIFYCENRVKVLSQVKGYQAKNRDKIALKKRVYREKNLERHIAKDQKYYLKNRVSILAQKKVYTKNHSTEKKVYNTHYYILNKENISVRNKKIYKPETGKNKNLLRKFGLSLVEWERMKFDQGGFCAICGGPGGKKGLGVDHDHDTGKIRGLLCGKCNSAIGLLNDSSAVVQMALNYLKLHGK